MKKFVKGLLLLTIAVAMIGCKASADDGNGNSNPYAPKDNIKIGETTYEYTGEVQLMEKARTIIGSDDYNQYHPGAFPEGRKVTLSPFIMGKYEVTQELYQAVMTDLKVKIGGESKDLNATPSYCTSTDPDFKNMLSDEEQKYRPVEGVTWYDACYFCNALSEKLGLTKAYSITDITVLDCHITSATVEPVTGANGYRLPTEAEWEYAARGGAAGVTNGTFANYWSGATTELYWYSENADLDSAGWYWYNIKSGKTESEYPSSGDAGYGTHQVGKKPKSNAAGLYDMSGNVWEWCYDWYNSNIALDDELYKKNGVVTDPSGPSSPQTFRVVRGGSWSSGANIDLASGCGVSFRDFNIPDFRGNDLGFRVVRSAQ